jgi:hypothetical protein
MSPTRISILAILTELSFALAVVAYSMSVLTRKLPTNVTIIRSINAPLARHRSALVVSALEWDHLE